MHHKDYSLNAAQDQLGFMMCDHPEDQVEHSKNMSHCNKCGWSYATKTKSNGNIRRKEKS